MFKHFVVALLCTGLAACSIHPLPDDVIGFNTGEVVRKIRCEARDAIKERAAKLLEHDHPEGQSNAMTARKKASADNLREHSENWQKIDLSIFSKSVRSLITKYKDGIIHYDFQFTMSEENNITSEANLLGIMAVGTDNLGFKASNNRTRKNIRAFRVKDSFSDILSARLTCININKTPNYQYPVMGNIGLAELVNTFFELAENHNLTYEEDKKTNMLTETLTFTTVITGSATPKIVLNPLGKRLSLANGSITGEAKRSDEHQVLVGLALPTDSVEVKMAADRKIDRGPLLLPSSRLGVSTDRSITSYQLDQFMTFQLEQNSLRALAEPRPVQVRLF